MSSAASNSRDRISDILRAACRVVLRDGAHGLRMANVAREAGVSKALVHYYFATRQELLRATFAFSSERWQAAVASDLVQVRSGAERLERFLLASFEPRAPFAEHSALWNEVWSSLRVDSELRPLVRDAYRTWVNRIISLIEEGRSDGSVPDEVSAVAAGRRLAAVAEGLDSMLYLSVVDRRKAQRLLRESLERELAP